MDKDPVLIHTLSLINDGVEPDTESCWNQFISEPEHYSVKLINEAPTDELSEAEVELINNIFNDYGHLNRWKLVDIVH